MRLFLLLIAITGSSLGGNVPASQSIDDVVLGFLCSDGPDNYLHNPGDPNAPPPCTEEEAQPMSRAGLDLTPRGKGDTCTASDGTEGICVKPTNCDEPLKPRRTKTIFSYREKSCHYQLQCCPTDKITQKKKKNNGLPAGCGWSNPGGYNLQSSPGEGFSDFGDFPFMVALLRRLDVIDWDKDDYIGGGALIHPSVVLTVAHKVLRQNPTTMKCRAGEWDTRTTYEIAKHQDRNVRKTIIHDQFYIWEAHYDAALLILETPFDVEGQRHIGVACLGQDTPVNGTLCYSMGWGKSFENSNTNLHSALLKKVQLPIVDSVTCEAQFRRTSLSSAYDLHHSLMCAGGEEGKDTCLGDGGSPLVCPYQTIGNLTKYQVYGLVAFGVNEECGKKDVPGGYANIPVMIEWINRKMAEEGFERTYI